MSGAVRVPNDPLASDIAEKAKRHLVQPWPVMGNVGEDLRTLVRGTDGKRRTRMRRPNTGAEPIASGARAACLRPGNGYYRDDRCGRSSGVERNLAKVEVVSSNLIARSIFSFIPNS